MCFQVCDAPLECIVNVAYHARFWVLVLAFGEIVSVLFVRGNCGPRRLLLHGHFYVGNASMHACTFNQSSRAGLRRTTRFFLHLGEIEDEGGRPVGRHVLPLQDVLLPLQLADLPLQGVNVLAPRLLGASGDESPARNKIVDETCITKTCLLLLLLLLLCSMQQRNVQRLVRCISLV